MPISGQNRTHIESAATRRLRVLLVVLPFVLTGYLLSSGDGGVAKLWNQAGRIDILRKDIARLERENAQVAEEVKLLTDDQRTIERIARERYGMVKDNESVYRVYPGPAAQPR